MKARNRMVTMRVATVVLGLAAAGLSASTVLAQPGATFEEAAQRLRAGRQVHIEDRSGTTIRGVVTAIGGDEIAVKQGDGERRIRQEDVVSLAERTNYAKRGALIGAVAGALACIRCGSGEHPDKDGFVLTGLLGAGVGALTGALVPRTRVIYRAPGHPVAFTVEPVLAPRGGGARVMLRW